jgi:hypothetical protein
MCGWIGSFHRAGRTRLCRNGLSVKRTRSIAFIFFLFLLHATSSVHAKRLSTCLPQFGATTIWDKDSSVILSRDLIVIDLGWNVESRSSHDGCRWPLRAQTRCSDLHNHYAMNTITIWGTPNVEKWPNVMFSCAENEKNDKNWNFTWNPMDCRFRLFKYQQRLDISMNGKNRIARFLLRLQIERSSLIS